METDASLGGSAGLLPYILLAVVLTAATLAVRLNGGGLLVDTRARESGQSGSGYGLFVGLGFASVALASITLIGAYLALSWKGVFLVHMLAMVVPFWIGRQIWRMWVQEGGALAMTEVTVLHLLAIGCGLWLAVLLWF